MKTIKACVWGLLAILVLYGTYTYLTLYWYKEPNYKLGVVTPGDIRNVTLALEPSGVAEFGVGGEATYQDPKWPLPTSMRVSFDDSSENHYMISIPTGLTKDFRGKVVLRISLDSNGYHASVETIDRHGRITKGEPSLVPLVK